MYRRRIEKKFLTTSANVSRPTQVYPSSQHKTQNTVVEKENDDDEVIQSSQKNEDESSRTQSRFKSQRAILVQATQQEFRKGKGYLEVTLYNCRMEFTEMGK